MRDSSPRQSTATHGTAEEKSAAKFQLGNLQLFFFRSEYDTRTSHVSRFEKVLSQYVVSPKMNTLNMLPPHG
jgi:hypothetical protein